MPDLNPTAETAAEGKAAVQAFVKSHGIGLTGGIATGKSTVARMIAAEGIPVFDADQLARDALAPGSKGHAAVSARFPKVLAADGSIDRKSLGAIVFADPPVKEWLEATIHPIIGELLAAKLIAAGLLKEPKLWFYEAALLFETGRDQEFRKIWTTTCPEDVQLARIKSRNPDTYESLKKAISAQLPSSEKARRSAVVINTDKSLSALNAEIVTLLAKERSLLITH